MFGWYFLFVFVGILCLLAFSVWCLVASCVGVWWYFVLVVGVWWHFVLVFGGICHWCLLAFGVWCLVVGATNAGQHSKVLLS